VGGLAFNAKGEFFEAQELCPEYYPANDAARRLRPDQVKARVNRAHIEPRWYAGDWLWITDRFSSNYYHWLCDCLPRLEAWVQSGNEPKRLILPRAVQEQGFVRESLRAFPEIEVGPLPDQKTGGIAERAWVAGPVAANGHHHPGWMAALADRMRRHAHAGGATGRKLWVTRAAAGKRRIANETELLPILERHRFRIVTMENLAFAEQVRLAASASILAGPHGAGLANAAFMNPGSAFVELRQIPGATNFFHSLAAARSLEYFYLPCVAERTGQPAHAADMVCDAKMLDALLWQVSAAVVP
jgi:capsular polysaccharide biosynthesis protein